MGWPQITYIILTMFGLGATVAQHGKPRGPHDAGGALLGALIAYGLLFAGGFFS